MKNGPENDHSFNFHARCLPPWFQPASHWLPGSPARRLPGSPAHRLTGSPARTAIPARRLPGSPAVRLPGSLAHWLSGSSAHRLRRLIRASCYAFSHLPTMMFLALKNGIENDHFFNFQAAQTKSHDPCHKQTSININLLASFSWFGPSCDVPQTNRY